MEILIGKGDTCQYVIASDIVSRQHCKLIREGNRYAVVDLGSTNGTFIRRARIPPHAAVLVEPGEEILVSGSIPLDWNLMRRMLDELDRTRMVPLEEIDRAIRARPRSDYPVYQASAAPPAPPAPRMPAPVPLQPQEPFQAPRPAERSGSGREPSLRNDLVYAAYANKSFTGSAFLTFVLYYIGFWIGGIIANFLFLGEAKRVREVTGVNPSGMGCLTFLIYTHFYIPLILIGILLFMIMTGAAHLGDIIRDLGF